jgi:hypothetical protein
MEMVVAKLRKFLPTTRHGEQALGRLEQGVAERKKEEVGSPPEIKK